jgi:hypothetical protein
MTLSKLGEKVLNGNMTKIKFYFQNDKLSSRGYVFIYQINPISV